MTNSAFAGLYVADLGGARTAMLGRMLADLGADVWSPPAHDRGHAAVDMAAYKSVFEGGRRPMADIERDTERANIVLCGALAEVPGLADLDTWLAAHSQAILVSVTPFGATGPFRNRPSSDLVNIAMSGYLHMTGRGDGPPLKSSAPLLSWRHACNHALAGLLLALRHRRQTGKGSHVDVAARETGLWMLTHTYQYWDMQGVRLSRKGSARDVGNAGTSIPSVYACKDGVVVWMVLGGRLAQGSLDKLVAWMASEGMAPEWLQAVDWMTLELSALESIEAFVEPFAAFFRTKTADELLERAIHDGFMLAPAYPMEKLLDDPQLEARAAWAPATFADKAVRIPAAPGHFDGFTWRPRNQDG